jgi:selenocysteine lyase/cysteine desulfurase
VVADALAPRTRLFCTTWVDSFSGHVMDAAGVGAVCRDAGVLFVLNATQGLGVRPLDVEAASVDAVTCAGYKWLCGPYGTGFCWISSRVMDRLRPGRRYWLPSARERGLHDLEQLTRGPAPAAPAVHDVFCTASFLNVLPWIAAVEYLTELGLERVGAHNAALVEALRKVAEDNGLASRAAGSGSVESPMLVIEGLRPEAALGLTSTLRERGIHVALRGGRIRVTPHVHNGPEDVERFASALATWRRHA